MPLYLDKYAGTGIKDDPFRPLHAPGTPGWASYDLRLDQAQPAGRCLLYNPTPLPGAADLEPIANLPDETVTAARRDRIFNALGESFTGRDNKVETILKDLVFRSRGARGEIKPGVRRAVKELVFQDTVWVSESVKPVREEGMDPTDNFTRANETPLAGNWSKVTGSDSTFNLSSNNVLAVAGTSNGTAYYWNANTFTNDQFSYVTAGNVGTDNGDYAPAARCAAGAFTLYIVHPKTDSIYKIVAGTWTFLASVAFSVVAGDVVGIQCEGSTIRALKNGVVILTTTDTGITSGSGGMWIYDTAVRVSAWTGGDIFAATINIVQSAKKVINGVNNTTFAFPSALTAGNLIIATQAHFSASGVITAPTDTLGHTFLSGGVEKTIGSYIHYKTFYVPNCLGGANTITFDVAGPETAFMSLVISEWSGVNVDALVFAGGRGPLDGNIHGNPSVFGGIPDSNNCMLYGVVVHNGNVTMATNTGWELLQKEEDGLANQPIGVQWTRQGVAATVSQSWILGGSPPTWIIDTLVFRPATSAEATEVHAASWGTSLATGAALVQHRRTAGSRAVGYASGHVPINIVRTVVASYTLQMAWNPGSFTDITNDVVRVNISRPLWSLFDPVTPGEMTVEVLNISGKYTPDNSTGPFANLMTNAREARFFASVSANTSLQLFQGFLDQISVPANDVQNGRVLLSFRDRARDFRHRIISTSLWVDYNVSSLFENVLTAAGIPLSQQSIDTMPDEADLSWFQDQSADSALSDLISFNFAKGYVSRTGVITILGRYYDQGVTPVNSYNEFLSLDYSLSDDAVINDARFESNPKQVAISVGTLSYITQPITIAASSSVAFVLEYLDPITRRAVPAVNMITPVSSADYQVSKSLGKSPIGQSNDASSTTSVSVAFFGETAVATIYNGSAADVFLHKFQLRGRHLPESPKLQRVTISSSSQNVYGRRSFFLSSKLLGEKDYLADYGVFLVDRQENPIPAIRAVVRNQSNSADLTMEPGNLISLSNSNTAIGSLHFIKRLEHDIDMSSGVQHTISLELERAAVYSIWTLDHPDRGALDSGNRLAF